MERGRNTDASALDCIHSSQRGGVDLAPGAGWTYSYRALAEVRIYLRARSGQPIGPLPLRSLEVLYGAHVVDEFTPISLDGRSFSPVAGNAEVFSRLMDVEQRLVNGDDPWADRTDDIPFGGVAGIDLSSTSPIEVLFTCARSAGTGCLSIDVEEVNVLLTYLDGKIVEVSTNSGELALATFLISQGVDARAVERATLVAPSMGGDLGAALIAAGAIAPNVYMERLVGWAKKVIGFVLGLRNGVAQFDQRPVTSPAVPLGLDRYGVIVECLRFVPREMLEALLSPWWGRPLIPAQLEGVTVEELKLPARELRVVKAIDGTRTLGAVMEAQGSSASDQYASALRSISFAVGIGWLQLGEDADGPQQREEARRLLDRFLGLQKKGPLDVLGVRASSSDEEVHSRYMTLAKEVHPDRTPPGAVPELLEARKQAFAIVQNAFEAVETSDKREALRKAADAGYDTSKDEQEIVRAVLEAETYFKKAEVLFKVKKFAEGLENLEAAIKRKPDDLEFKLHRIYYRLMAGKASDTEIKGAIADIGAIMKKEPNLAAGWLFLARLQKQAGNMELAVKYFKKLIEFDPKNSEANSELRLANMRQQKEKKKWL